MHGHRRGFTVVELIIVIAVVAVLAAVTIIGYGTWRAGTDKTALTNDLTNATAALESNANFKDTYASSVTQVHTPSEGTQLSGGAIAGGSYCVDATRQDASMFMSKLKVALPGTCPTAYFDPSKSQTYNGSGTVVKDLSGNGNNAIFRDGLTDNVVGPTYVSSEAEGVFRFEGADKYYVTNQLVFGPNTTWTACAKTMVSANGFNMFMGKYLPYFGTYTGGTGLIFSNTIGGSQRSVALPSATTTLNTWYCYAFTTRFDGTNTTMSIYINGELRTAAAYAGQQSDIAHKFTVGDGYQNTWYPFNGQVADVAIYPRTLSPEEIKSMFEILRGKFGI